MSNTETAPVALACTAKPFAGRVRDQEVSLSGPPAMLIRRTRPNITLRPREYLGGTASDWNISKENP